MKARWLLVLLLGLVLFVAPVQAYVIIDFADKPLTGGTIYAPDNTFATGEDILIGTMTVSGTPTMDGNYVVIGSLDFNTSANFVTIFGGIPALGLNDVFLLSGSFSSFSISFPTITSVQFFGQGPDEKNLDLLAALGIPLDTPFKFFGFTLGGFGSGGYYIAASTDFINEGGKIPEPISLILLGSGLAGVGLVRRFRKK